MQQNLIVDIPENRIKFFGGRGKMLLPTPEVLSNMIKTIPESKLLTLDALRKALAKQFEVLGVCPVTTKKSLIALANDSEVNVPFWRVLKPTGELLNYLPGGLESQANQLKAEGFSLDDRGKTLKVKNFRQSLA